MAKPPRGGSALILTGGGNRGAIQAGAVLALFEHGFRPDLIIGVSAGAINGSFLSFYPTADGAHRMIEIWRSLDRSTLFGHGSELLRGLAAVLLQRPSIYSNRGLKTVLTTELPSRSFDDTAVALVVVATDLDTGEARYLRHGDVVQAVLASAAAPLRLPPVEVAGERLIDGAIADPVPIEQALKAGMEHVVVVEPGYACTGIGASSTALGVFIRSMEIIAKGRTIAELQIASDAARVTHLGLTCHADIQLTDLSRTDEMIESGYDEARVWLSTAGADWIEDGAR